MLSDLINLSNKNEGFLSLLIFFAASVLIPLFLWNRSRSKPKLKIGILDKATLCSSFTVDFDENEQPIHRTAFLIYLEITNIGNSPIYISNVELGYRSEMSENPEAFRWLLTETPMSSDYLIPHGDGYQVIPFLKQKNTMMENDTNGYMRPGEYKNGLVYFEQERSLGKNHPYMDDDYKVCIRVKVNDTKGNSWDVEGRVYKVKIEAIRETNPDFGLSSESIGLTAIPEIIPKNSNDMRNI